ncbi:MAG: radical SAM family heme chaperone HemW [Ginsengibacter sp.]
MAGIYIHIPFCKQACYYCNFYFSTSVALKDDIISSIIREIEIRSSFLQNEIENESSIISKDENIETIYFGGGTPSLLSSNEFFSILTTIKQNYKVASGAEINLEANPDDITIEKLNEWKLAGINRLSIGVQSFFERDLKWMNRAHDASQALLCIESAIAAGFDNFSIDLIFGIPDLNNSEWKENVNRMLDFKVPHLACYALTVEPKTALQKMIALKKKKDINNDSQAMQYSILMKMMWDAGYEHYEISNFAKPGFRSKHNSSYWQGKKYIGFGPSAHSYNGKMRMWNKVNNSLYIKSLQKNTIPYEKEILTETQKINEYIMISLRTMEGMDLQFIENTFSKNERRRIENLIDQKAQKEMILSSGDKIILSNHGKLFADRIAMNLFV